MKRNMGKGGITVKENRSVRVHEICLLDRSADQESSAFRAKILDLGGEPPHLSSVGWAQVCLVAEDGGVLCVHDQTIPCKSGELYVIAPNLPHGFFLKDGSDSLVMSRLSFPVELLPERDAADERSQRFCFGVFGDGSGVSYAMLDQQTLRKINTLLAAIEGEAVERRQDWMSVTRAFLVQLLVTVGRYINCSIKNETPALSKNWTLVTSVQRIVKERFDDCNLTLGEVADFFYVSKSYLSRVFQELTGQPFSVYLRSVRMEQACRLLRETDMNVEQIVEKCGLRDVHSFYRVFSEHMQMTPNGYRKRLALSGGAEDGAGEAASGLLRKISEDLQKGKAKAVVERVERALELGISADRILEEGLLLGMELIGEKFRNNQVYVPEVLVAARAMNVSAQLLKPHLSTGSRQTRGRVCIGTVEGDLHDIGKNLVKMMMEGSGLEVIDLGVDVSPKTFVQTAIEQNCRLICCSALLTTTMNVTAQVVREAERAGIRDRVRIMIGGAPITEEFCKRIGADRYTDNAAEAAKAAVELLEELEKNEFK